MYFWMTFNFVNKKSEYTCSLIVFILITLNETLITFTKHIIAQISLKKIVKKNRF